MRRTVHKVKLEAKGSCLEPCSSKMEYDARSSMVNGQQLMLSSHELEGVRIELRIRANISHWYDANRGMLTRRILIGGKKSGGVKLSNLQVPEMKSGEQKLKQFPEYQCT